MHYYYHLVSWVQTSGITLESLICLSKCGQEQPCFTGKYVYVWIMFYWQTANHLYSPLTVSNKSWKCFKDWMHFCQTNWNQSVPVFRRLFSCTSETKCREWIRFMILKVVARKVHQTCQMFCVLWAKCLKLRLISFIHIPYHFYK